MFLWLGIYSSIACPDVPFFLEYLLLTIGNVYLTTELSGKNIFLVTFNTMYYLSPQIICLFRTRQCYGWLVWSTCLWTPRGDLPLHTVCSLSYFVLVVYRLSLGSVGGVTGYFSLSRSFQIFIAYFVSLLLEKILILFLILSCKMWLIAYLV